MDVVWDCIIVGGGAAGLSAGLVLGRARRSTLLIDAGAQSNLAAHGIGGLLGHDGRAPAELYETGRRELSAYPSVEVRRGSVVSGERVDEQFVLQLADCGRERTRRVLLATGMDYRPPAVPGLAELWGSRCFTARSATAGRRAISRWEFWLAASTRCTCRNSCGTGARRSCS